jgi:D-alanyl-D-alanine carboxypeptidase (penicillin-binding protein 5/6)
LVDLDSYTSVAEKSADKRIYPASMTKVMSLLVACENLKSLKTTLTVTQETVDYMNKMGGSGLGLKVGEKVSTQDLLYLTAYQSDTVAIMMLANHIAGSEAKFVELMNAKARTLNLGNTHFSNCTGLHAEDNYTTCREMAAIFAYALENPLCKELLTSYNAYSVGGKYTLYSSWYSGRFDDNPRLATVTVKGGKTGYIDESGFCLVSYAEGRSSGKKYIQVIVGQPKGSGLTEDLSVKDIKYVYNTYAK